MASGTGGGDHDHDDHDHDDHDDAGDDDDSYYLCTSSPLVSLIYTSLIATLSLCISVSVSLFVSLCLSLCLLSVCLSLFLLSPCLSFCLSPFLCLSLSPPLFLSLSLCVCSLLWNFVQRLIVRCCLAVASVCFRVERSSTTRERIGFKIVESSFGSTTILNFF